MRLVSTLAAIAILVVIPLIGAGLGWQWLFGIVIPYLAIAVFLIGFSARLLSWARVPVPFRVPTTCGQQKSLPWLKHSRFEAPFTWLQVAVRMALEVLLFRSLFRNTKFEMRQGPRLVYGSNKWLWLFGLVFHYSLLTIFVRHFKYFVEPIPGWVGFVQSLDGFFQVGLPIIYLSDILVLVALGYLFFRRVAESRLRYISLSSDYFPLLLIGTIACTGILMRYLTKVDIVAVKTLGKGLLGFHPTLPEAVSPLFYVHLFLVCVLMTYFPFSKLMHMGGIFLSPTRNLANNSRAKRHLNPWNPPVPVHTYAEYEDEFREVMRAAGLPLEKN